LWLNIGDSYNAAGRSGTGHRGKQGTADEVAASQRATERGATPVKPKKTC
jgi:hypothetical protein